MISYLLDVVEAGGDFDFLLEVFFWDVLLAGPEATLAGLWERRKFMASSASSSSSEFPRLPGFRFFSWLTVWADCSLLRVDSRVLRALEGGGGGDDLTEETGEDGGDEFEELASTAPPVVEDFLAPDVPAAEVDFFI